MRVWKSGPDGLAQLDKNKTSKLLDVIFVHKCQKSQICLQLQEIVIITPTAVMESNIYYCISVNCKESKGILKKRDLIPLEIFTVSCRRYECACVLGVEGACVNLLTGVLPYLRTRTKMESPFKYEHDCT